MYNPITEPISETNIPGQLVRASVKPNFGELQQEYISGDNVYLKSDQIENSFVVANDSDVMIQVTVYDQSRKEIKNFGGQISRFNSFIIVNTLKSLTK